MSIELGRNINYDRTIEKSIWEPLGEHPLFTNLSGLDIMMIALALGFNKGVRTKLKKKYPNVNLDGDNPTNRKAQAYLIAIAVHEKGLDFIDGERSEIRNISEEYINTGLIEMEKIFLKNDDNTIGLNKLMLILKKKFKK